jgi:hypothetical protein
MNLLEEVKREVKRIHINGCRCKDVMNRSRVIFVYYKDHYQAFWGVLIDLIVEFLVLIIKPFDNHTEI